MHITRRTMLTRTTGLAAAALLLQAGSCANQTPMQITQEALQYGATIANGIANLATNLQGVPPATAAQIAAIAKDAAGAATNMNTAVTQNNAQALAQQIVNDVLAAAAAAQPYVPAGSTAATILADLQLAAPLLLTAVGIVSSLAAAPLGAPAAMQALRALPVVKLP